MNTAEATDADAPVRATDNDAALARLSAVQKRYLTDPFITALVPRAHFQQPRPPLINNGTYLRAQGIDELVESWMRTALQSADGGQAEGKVQIVSLGAGSDTRFWRLTTGPHAAQIVKYVELDYPEITSRKAMAVRKNKVMSSLLGEEIKIEGGGTTLKSKVYNLLPVDLRLPPPQTLATVLPNLLSPTIPTLLLFECVLVYLTPATSDTLLQWFVDYFSKSSVLGAVVYEMFGLGDSFGRVMLNNLKARNVSLPGADPYPDVHSLPQRFLRLNFTTAQALTLRQIRHSYISKAELERLSTLEMLDEIEELDLVLEHYAITWGVQIPLGHPEDTKKRWREWGLKQKAVSRA